MSDWLAVHTKHHIQLVTEAAAAECEGGEEGT